jgi:hypothetical protein
MALRYDRDRDDYFQRCRESGSIPSNDALKLVVLERLLDAEFELDETYDKATVTARLREHFKQAILLRREFVNFGYMGYDNRANEYTVRKLELDEADVRENRRLERHAKDIGVLD